MRIQALLASILLLTGSQAAWAEGLYWESSTSGVGQPENSRVYAMPRKIRVEQAGSHQVILRADRDELILLDTSKKTYQKLRFSDLESMARTAQEQMHSAMSQVEEEMKGMPAEQRAMVEKMMQKLPGKPAAKSATLTVEKTGEKKNINGFECTKYIATEDGKTVLTAWTTQDVKDFSALHEDWVSMQKRLAKMSPSMDAAGEAYGKMEGFPIQIDMGEIRTVVTKVEQRNTPPDAFEVPPGYKEEKIPLPGSGH